MNRKGLGLLLAGLAAYGYYKFSRMSPTEKSAMKQKARKYMDDGLGKIENLFRPKKTTNTASNSYGKP